MKPRRLDDRELASILANEERNAVNYSSGEIAEQQDLALDYYQGEQFGDEQEGRSAVVTRDVAEVVDWLLPDLLRIFTSGDQVVVFEPVGEEDEEAAKQATDYIGHIFYKDNDGFRILHDWFKDALIQKVGIVKAYREPPKQHREEYDGVSPEEFMLWQQDETIEIIEAGVEDEDAIGPPMLQVTLLRTEDKGLFKIENIPPEEFLISQQTRDLESADYVAHRTLKTETDLLEMGFTLKEVQALPSGTDEEQDDRRRRRFDDEEGHDRDTESETPGMREMHVLEEYVRIDADGDGIAELRRVLRCGGEILENEPVDSNPFASVCPVPMAHKFFGMSVAEQVMDTQRVHSTLLRQMLDNLYLTNNPRTEVPDAVCGEDTIADLLTVRPGGIVRSKGSGGLVPIEVPFVAGQTFPMLEYMNAQKEARTGVTRYSQGMHADTLNKTASGINLIQQAGNLRKELIARIFAETGVKTLFRKLLHLVVAYQDRARTVRLRGRWVEYDPRRWNPEMDMTVNVGLGSSNKDQQAMHLMTLMQVQKEAMSVGLATPDNLYNSAALLVEAMGFKSPERFFVDPESEEGQRMREARSQPPPPDPRIMLQQQAAQLDMQSKQADMAMKAQEQQQKLLQDQQKHEQEMVQSAEDHRQDMLFKREEAALKYGLEETQVAMKLTEAQSKAALEDAARQKKREELKPAGYRFQVQRGADDRIAGAVLVPIEES